MLLIIQLFNDKYTWQVHLAIRHTVIPNNIQGRRRVFKSGPAEEIIECRRHEWGRAREGDSPSLGGLGGLPQENFEFLVLLCVF